MLKCEEKQYNKKFNKDQVETMIAFLKEKALEDGFKLSKATRNKTNSHYFELSFGRASNK